MAVTAWLENLLVVFDNPIVRALAIFVFFLILAKSILWLLNRYILKFAEETENKADELIIKSTETAFCYIIVLFGVKLSLRSIAVTDGALQHTVDTIILFIITYILMSVADIFIYLWGTHWARQHKSFHDDVIPLFHNFAKIFIVLIALVILFEIWGVSIGPLLASLGVISIALGFAMQDSLKNIFGGVSLILDKTFKMNDVIKLETGELGRIVDIGLRSTKMITLEEEMLIVPNGDLSNAKIINYAKPNDNLRIEVSFGVAYGSDVDKTSKVALAAVKKLPGLMKDREPFIRFEKLNDFSLDFTIFIFIDDYQDRYELEDKALRVIYKSLLKNKIQIPFPTRTVYMKK